MRANDRQVGGSHYQSTIQHWDVIDDYDIPYLDGCASKYLTRYMKKDGLVGVEKSLHYVEKHLEKLEWRGQVSRARGAPPEELVEMFMNSNGVLDSNARAAIKLILRWTHPSDLRLAHDFIKNLMRA